MFIGQAIRPGTSFWMYFLKYFMGLAIIGLAYVIGQVPFTVAVIAKSVADGKGMNISPDKIMSILEPNLSLFLVLLTFVATLAAIFLTVRYLHKQSIRSLTTSRPM